MTSDNRNNNKPQKRPGGLTAILIHDSKTGETDTFIWKEDHPRPPIIKPETDRKQ